MQSNPISDDSFRNCPPVQDPWASCHEQGLLSALSLGFPPQTGWLAGSAGALPAMAICCPVPALPPLPTPVSVSWSEWTFSAAASQTSSLHPGTKLPLSARRFVLLITCSWTSWAVLKLHTPASRPCPVLLALFHSPGHINTDFLHSLSLNVFFYLPGGNFALVASKVDPNCHGKVSGEAVGL